MSDRFRDSSAGQFDPPKVQPIVRNTQPTAPNDASISSPPPGYGQPQSQAASQPIYSPPSGYAGHSAPQQAQGQSPRRPSYHDSSRSSRGESYRSKAQLFGILALIIFPLIFGPLAYFNGKKAQECGVQEGNAWRIIGLTQTIIYGVGMVIGILYVVFFMAAIGSMSNTLSA